MKLQGIPESRNVLDYRRANRTTQERLKPPWMTARPTVQDTKGEPDQSVNRAGKQNPSAIPARRKKRK